MCPSLEAPGAGMCRVCPPGSGLEGLKAGAAPAAGEEHNPALSLGFGGSQFSQRLPKGLH